MVYESCMGLLSRQLLLAGPDIRRRVDKKAAMAIDESHIEKRRQLHWGISNAMKPISVKPLKSSHPKAK